MRRVFALFTLLAAATLTTVSCGKTPTYEDGFKDGAEAGYRKGAEDAYRQMENSADQFREKLRGSVQRTLMLFAAATALLTLFGDSVAEHIRRSFVERFKVPAGAQVLAALFIYAAAALALLLCGFMNFGFLPTLPVLVLTAAGLVSLARYVKYIGAGDRPHAKAALAKIKSLLFLASAALIVFALLSKAGFMNIRVC